MTFPATTLDTAVEAPSPTALATAADLSTVPFARRPRRAAVSRWWRAVKRELRYLGEGLTDPGDDNREVLSAFAHGMSPLVLPWSIWTAVENGWTSMKNGWNAVKSGWNAAAASRPIRMARELWGCPAIQFGVAVVFFLALALAGEGCVDTDLFALKTDDGQDLPVDELLADGLFRMTAGRSRALPAKGVKTNTQGP
jgi:hypothetical protein